MQLDLAKLKPNSPPPTPIDSWDKLVKAYQDRFKGIGRFPGTYQITLWDDAWPLVHASCKCPIAMRPLVCEKLDKILEQGIIIPVTEPTDLVSSLAYSWKANGKLGVCLDPKDLNMTIWLDHYRPPTVEEIAHGLVSSTSFTKLDGTSSYLCIILDYKLSLLTTYNTLWGWFHFVNLPWSLASTWDTFQHMMDQVLNQFKGVIGIADDVVIHGKDDEEHDWWFNKLMKAAQVHGLIFNGEKCAVKCNLVKFFGCVYYKDGDHPDPAKVRAVKEMLAPQSPPELQSFLGMVTYQASFIPSLSTHSTTIGTPHKRCQIHLECNLPRSIWQSKVLGMHWHHTPILQCEETSGHTSWCLELPFNRIIAQLPLPPECLPQQNSAMLTMNASCWSMFLVLSTSAHTFLNDTLP